MQASMQLETWISDHFPIGEPPPMAAYCSRILGDRLCARHTKNAHQVNEQCTKRGACSTERGTCSASHMSAVRISGQSRFPYSEWPRAHAGVAQHRSDLGNPGTQVVLHGKLHDLAVGEKTVQERVHLPCVCVMHPHCVTFSCAREQHSSTIQSVRAAQGCAHELHGYALSAARRVCSQCCVLFCAPMNRDENGEYLLLCGRTAHVHHHNCRRRLAAPRSHRVISH